MRKVLAIPDLHFPWHDQDTLTWIYKLNQERKPDVIIQLGDLYDMYSHSRFARTHNLCTPKQEIAEGRLGAATMWKHLKSGNPKAVCYQLRGNHDVRADKRILEMCPEVESLVAMQPLFEFPGVKTIMDASEELELDGVLYIHGHYMKLGDHMNYYLQPVVHGHTHRGGSIYRKIHGQTIWELDCGFASDESQVPLRYTATRRTHWTLGCGWIDDGGPSFMVKPRKK